MENLFIVLFAYLRRMRLARLQKAAKAATSIATVTLPLGQAKEVIAELTK